MCRVDRLLIVSVQKNSLDTLFSVHRGGLYTKPLIDIWVTQPPAIVCPVCPVGPGIQIHQCRTLAYRHGQLIVITDRTLDAVRLPVYQPITVIIDRVAADIRYTRMDAAAEVVTLTGQIQTLSAVIEFFHFTTCEGVVVDTNFVDSSLIRRAYCAFISEGDRFGISQIEIIRQGIRPSQGTVQVSLHLVPLPDQSCMMPTTDEISRCQIQGNMVIPQATIRSTIYRPAKLSVGNEQYIHLLVMI